MFPNYAYVVVAAVLGVSALVWTVGARLRVRRGEEALPTFRSMMGRGLFAPTAMIFMAADFGIGPTSWVVWVGMVFGSWLVTLSIVRVALGSLEPATIAPSVEVVEEPTTGTVEPQAAASMA